MDLFVTIGSSPCRAVDLVASALGINSKIKHRELDMRNGEHLKPEFVKVNPQHTVPTLVDDGFTLWESRTICRYLVNKYGGANNSLYPADAKTRALIDQRLDFDLGTLFSKFALHLYPQLFGVKSEEGSLQKVQEALGFLNIFLEGHKYAVGDNLTIADFSLVTTISTIEAAEISIKEYPNIVRWYELVKKTAPNFQKANEEPLAKIKDLIKNRKQIE